MVSVTVEFTAQTRSSRGRAARAAYFTDPSNQVDVNVSLLIRKCALVDIWTFYSLKNENFIIKHKQQLEGKDRLAAARLLCEAGVKFAEAVILKLKLLEVQLTAESTPVHVSLPDSSTQVSVLQVSLDVRGITLRIPIPCRLPESENSPAGLWQGGAVDSGSHPVQDPLPASQVNSHKHTDQQCSVSQQGSKKCVSYIGLFQSFYCWIIKRKTCFFPKKNQDINSCVMCDVGVVSRDLQQETLRQSHSSWLRSSFVYNHHLFSLCILVVVLAILLYILRLRRIHQREQRQAEALNLLWVEEGEALLPWGRGRVLMTRRVSCLSYQNHDQTVRVWRTDKGTWTLLNQPRVRLGQWGWKEKSQDFILRKDITAQSRFNEPGIKLLCINFDRAASNRETLSSSLFWKKRINSM